MTPDNSSQKTLADAQVRRRLFDAFLPEARMVQFIEWAYTMSLDKLAEELEFYEAICTEMGKFSHHPWQDMVGPSLQEFRMRRDYLRGLILEMITEGGASHDGD